MDIKIPKFICHSDFDSLVPINVFHKQHDGTVIENSPKELQNRHVLFRKKFNIDEVETAVMKITAVDYYKLYINGVFVTQGPASAYPSAYYYNEIDVSEYLVSGENVIAVHTYYQGLINRVWVSGDNGRKMLTQYDKRGCYYYLRGVGQGAEVEYKSLSPVGDGTNYCFFR